MNLNQWALCLSVLCAMGPAYGSAKKKNILFINTALDGHFGRLAVASQKKPSERQIIDAWVCDRISFSGGKGICLTSDHATIPAYRADIFDAQYHPLFSFSLFGIPNRSRVSDDGRLGAITVFTAGSNYGNLTMTTQTQLFDLETHATLADLEQFTIWRDDKKFKEIDFNFWGVTFARNANDFYATLSSRGKIYLIQGNVDKREGRVIREGIECSSLSPDNTRLVFKKRVTSGRQAIWRMAVLNLATMKETELAETRSVDEQVEWLDDKHLVYSLPQIGAVLQTMKDTWVVPADGSGPPKKLLTQAYSPVAI